MSDSLHLPFPTKGPTLGSRAEQESRNRSLYGDDYYSLSVYLRGCYPRTLSTRSVTTRLPSSRPPYRSSSHPPLLRHMSAWRAAPERAPGNSLCPFQEARAPLGAARCLMAHGSRMVLGTDLRQRPFHRVAATTSVPLRSTSDPVQKIAPRLVPDLEHADVSGLPLLVR